MKEIQRIVALNLSMNGQSVDFEKSFIQIGKQIYIGGLPSNKLKLVRTQRQE